MEEKTTEYAREQEMRHKRKIVLPCVIPWEYGSNKHASQKGSAAFGTIRTATTKIQASKNFIETREDVLPQITFPKKRATQSGETSFGSTREQVTRVTNTDSTEKVPINKISEDRMTETILKKWAQPNHEANNSMIGKRRDNVFDPDAIRCSPAIPRFQDPRNNIAERNKKSLYAHDKEMRNREQIELTQEQYMAWMGGQTSTTISNASYYDRLMSQRELDPQVIKKRLEEERLKRSESPDGSEGDSGAHTMSEDVER